MNMDVESTRVRSQDEITALLTVAKLNPAELRGCTTCLYFSNDLQTEELRLVEVDEDLASTLIKGERLIIRGEKPDSAVLCTKSKTYELREAETSNSLLLLPSCATDNHTESGVVCKEVIALKHDYLELRPIRPRLKRLKLLLEEHLYCGHESDDNDQHDLSNCTTEHLLDSIQASEEELLQALADMNACYLNGHWRLLDLDLCSRVLSSLFALRDELGGFQLPDNVFPLDTCCTGLEDLYSKEVTKNVLQRFCRDSCHGDTCHLSEDKVCRFYAELLLKTVTKFNLQEFDAAWKMMVPDGYICSRYQLEGLCIIDEASRPAIIQYFPMSELPDDAADRFDALFKVKDKWTANEITPFISDLCADKTGQGNLLMKYSRAYTLGGVRVYSSKKIGS